MYTTKCDKGCVINDENVSFWTVPVSLSDSHTATVDVVGDRPTIHPSTCFRARLSTSGCSESLFMLQRLDEALRSKKNYTSSFLFI